MAHFVQCLQAIANETEIAIRRNRMWLLRTPVPPLFISCKNTLEGM